jgi:hypothetical protein
MQKGTTCILAIRIETTWDGRRGDKWVVGSCKGLSHCGGGRMLIVAVWIRATILKLAWNGWMKVDTFITKDTIRKMLTSL